MGVRLRACAASAFAVSASARQVGGQPSPAEGLPQLAKPAAAGSEREVRLRATRFGGQPPRETRAEAGDPNVRQLEPHCPVAETA
jgi:hypothetical protein